MITYLLLLLLLHGVVHGVVVVSSDAIAAVQYRVVAAIGQITVAGLLLLLLLLAVGRVLERSDLI